MTVIVSITFIGQKTSDQENLLSDEEWLSGAAWFHHCAFQGQVKFSKVVYENLPMYCSLNDNA